MSPGWAKQVAVATLEESPDESFYPLEEEELVLMWEELWVIKAETCSGFWSPLPHPQHPGYLLALGKVVAKSPQLVLNIEDFHDPKSLRMKMPEVV